MDPKDAFELGKTLVEIRVLTFAMGFIVGFGVGYIIAYLWSRRSAPKE